MEGEQKQFLMHCLIGLHHDDHHDNGDDHDHHDNEEIHDSDDDDEEEDNGDGRYKTSLLFTGDFPTN